MRGFIRFARGAMGSPTQGWRTRKDTSHLGHHSFQVVVHDDVVELGGLGLLFGGRGQAPVEGVGRLGAPGHEAPPQLGGGGRRGRSVLRRPAGP